tara:strand:- start:1294 stop:1629 length:336 start_codon:yes stop_codon:yes gene_type:complete
MSLGRLIKALESCPEGAVFKEGFSNPHSYRGDYYELAVEPTFDVTREEMLACLQSVLNTELEGYKGGEFIMHEDVDVYLAYHSYTSQTLVTGCGARYGESFVILTEEAPRW